MSQDNLMNQKNVANVAKEPHAKTPHVLMILDGFGHRKEKMTMPSPMPIRLI